MAATFLFETVQLRFSDSIIFQPSKKGPNLDFARAPRITALGSSFFGLDAYEELRFSISGFAMPDPANYQQHWILKV